MKLGVEAKNYLTHRKSEHMKANKVVVCHGTYSSHDQIYNVW